LIFHTLIRSESHRWFVCAAMNVLDGDDVRLSARGRYAERDIVQVSWVYTCVCHVSCSDHFKYHEAVNVCLPFITWFSWRKWKHKLNWLVTSILHWQWTFVIRLWQDHFRRFFVYALISVLKWNRAW